MAIIVGDIHGNVEKVKAFLDYRPDQEHIALGDYVDSFFEPPARQLMALNLLLKSDAVLIWGNHDLHYLLNPPFICTGFQHGREKPLHAIIETNTHRFVAAHVVDGWLCTHAGVHVRLAKRENESAIADRLNRKMTEYLDRPCMPGAQSIFAIGGGRGGKSRSGGIFWFDFQREDGLDLAIRQIFGHTENKMPVVTESYVALDTTNNKETVYLFDTQGDVLVKLPMPSRVQSMNRLFKE